MRPVITGDAKALREERFVRFAWAIDAKCSYEELREPGFDHRGDAVTWHDLRWLIDGLRDGDLPEPEPTGSAALDDVPNLDCWHQPKPTARDEGPMTIAEALNRTKPTAKAEEGLNYTEWTCPGCGHNPTADNRRIKELERDRDEAVKALELFEYDTVSAYAKGAEDFRESVAKALEEEAGTCGCSEFDPETMKRATLTAKIVFRTCTKIVRSHPIPKPTP